MEEQQESKEFEITKIGKSSLPGSKKYEIRWTVFNYSRLKPNEFYTMRSIIIKKKIRQLTLFKDQDVDQNNVNLILSMRPAPKSTNVSFCIVGKNSRKVESSQPPVPLTVLSLKRRACFVESPDIIVDDTLTVLLRITRYVTGSGLTIFESMKQKPDIGFLLDSGLFADMEIVAGEKTFLAHKAILSARSSRFATMFDTKDTEKRFIIDVADPEAVREMLNYLYTDETGHLNLELALNLLQLANKYKLEGLKFKAASFLIKEMSMDYAMKILLGVKRYNHDDLEHYCTEYIANNLALAKQHDDWASFRKHKLLYDAVEQYAAVYSTLY